MKGCEHDPGVQINRSLQRDLAVEISVPVVTADAASKPGRLPLVGDVLTTCEQAYYLQISFNDEKLPKSTFLLQKKSLYQSCLSTRRGNAPSFPAVARRLCSSSLWIVKNPRG